MSRRSSVSWAVGVLVATVGGTAVAQDASRAPATCSGFMCSIFGSKIEDAPDPAARVPGTPVTAKGPARKNVKPPVVVTIAADGAEAARLKVLTTALPKTRVHIVGTDAGRSADFTVAPAVDGPAPREKARLFTEQLHIVAGPGVTAPADLAGKVVSFGPDKSPAQAAARKAFAALGVAVKETPLDFDNALDGLATGDIAAAVVLAPQPDSRLAHLKSTPGLHLVSWPEGASVPDGAVSATIEGSAYPSLARVGEHIRAVGLEAALDASGKGATGPAAKAFLQALSQHSGTLAKRGFDLLAADAEARGSRRVASMERR